MACPYFMPTERLENGAWLHATRLPLGCGWTGHCTAPGHEGETPAPDEIQEFCNLGYAQACGRLPQDRSWDSVRFGARMVSDAGSQSRANILIRYACERNHRPVEHGTLQFDAGGARWERKHTDLRVQRMAECFLESYLAKRKKQEVETAAS